ncbi:MAG: DUF58 domain-containing protein [Pseudomonadota bacterium]
MKTRKRDTNVLGTPIFHFSSRFFMVFGTASIAIIAVYLTWTTNVVILLTMNIIVAIAAAMDYFLTPVPSMFGLNRPKPYPLAVDGPNDIFIDVVNRSGRWAQLLIQDDFPPTCLADNLPLMVGVGPGRSVRLSYRLVPQARGDGEFGDIDFWILGRLGLVWKHGRSEGRCAVKMYPGLSLIKRRKPGLWKPQARSAQRIHNRKGSGTEFESLREYVAGDDSRLIHWSTTARKGRLIVRQNREERGQTIYLILDAGRMMTARIDGKTKLDFAIEAALLLAYGALEMGDKVGVMVAAQDVLCHVAPSGGSGQFGRILDATYSVQARFEEPRYYVSSAELSAKLRRRTLIVVFTDLIDERSSEGLIRYVLGLVPRHLPLVLAMSDTQTAAAADAVPSTAQDLYRGGVASEILYRREKLMAKMIARGAAVIDTPAAEISSAALDRYLEIKARGSL